MAGIGRVYKKPVEMAPEEAKRALPVIKIVSDAQREASKAAGIALAALPKTARDTEIARLLEYASRNPLNIKSAKFQVGVA